MIEFPPEFYGLVAALWATYQPTVLIWMAVMFAAVVIMATAVLIWNILRPILGR